MLSLLTLVQDAAAEGGDTILVDPIAIAADPTTNELFVLDSGGGASQTSRLLRVLLGDLNSKTAMVSLVAKLPPAAGDLAVHSPTELFVTAGAAVLAVTRPLSPNAANDDQSKEVDKRDEEEDDEKGGEPRTVIASIGTDHCQGANPTPQLRGIAIDASGRRFVLCDPGTNRVVECTLQPRRATWTPRVIAGGNESSGGRCVADGTASAVELFRPTAVCFMQKDILFCDTGHRRIRVVADAYTHATRLVPIVRLLGDAFSLTANTELHSVTLGEAMARVQCARSFFDSQAKASNNITGKRKGAQGPEGCVSVVVRKALRNMVTVMGRLRLKLRAQGVPLYMVDTCILPMVLTTLRVERFFPLMRKLQPNPYMLEYAHDRARATLLSAYRASNAAGFAMTWGGKFRPERAHYSSSRASQALPLVVARKTRTRAAAAMDRNELRQSSVEGRKAEEERRKGVLVLLRRVCARLRGVPQARVTDKAKEGVGAAPGISYAQQKAGEAGGDARGHLHSGRAEPQVDRALCHSVLGV